MSTPTPINDIAAGAPLPAGLPDIDSLARLAVTFFGALPTNAPADRLAVLPVESSPATAVESLSAGQVGLAHGALRNPTPALGTAYLQPPAASSIAALASRPHPAALSSEPRRDPSSLVLQRGPSVAALGVPTPGAPTPGIPTPEVSAPTVPAWPSAAEAVTPGSLPAHGDRVTAQSFGLPGQPELTAIVQSLFQAAPSVPAAAASGTFYFIRDNAAAPAPGHPIETVAQRPALDVHAIRRDFPILAERINGRPLVWLDNAATTHKPQAVIDRLSYFYAHENSNIHRAAHALAARATDAYEAARQKAARFLGAASADEIVFVRGATEGINLVAQSWGRHEIGEGDEIVVSHLEHHANIVPWQQLADEKGARLRVIPVDDSGQLRLDEFQRLLNRRTRLVAVTQVSNALGTITPVHEIARLAHAAGALVLIDGAQAVSHMPVDVRAIDADFYVFSGHKLFGPTGIGVVYGKAAVLDATPPWQGGGNMIADVTFEKTTFQAAPARFEAGTGNIADAVGLGAAIDYLERIGLHNVARYEHALLEYATQGLRGVPGLRLIGTAREKAGVLSFVLDGYRTEDVGRALSEEGIAVRAGHHCAQPILRRFGVEATVRPSLAFYNTCDEIDLLVTALRRLAARR